MIFVAIISVCGKEIPKSIAIIASEIGNVFSQCREPNDPFIYYLDGAVKHTNAIARTTSRDVASVFQTVAPAVAGSHVHVALDVASVVACLVCGQSRDCRGCRRVLRRVPNSARVGVFCASA